MMLNILLKGGLHKTIHKYAPKIAIYNKGFKPAAHFPTGILSPSTVANGPSSRVQNAQNMQRMYPFD